MKTINNTKEQDENLYLISKITQKYDEMEDSRRGQLTDIRTIRNAIYSNNIPTVNEWNTQITLL